jgi:hypothetical protein
MNKKSALRIVGIVLAISLVAGAAWSVQSLRLVSFTLLPQVGPGPGTCIDLSSVAGNQPLLRFVTPASRAIIRFNAECSVAGPGTNFLQTRIIVDPFGAAPPFVVTPTNSDLALCSGNGTATFNDGWVSASIQAYAALPAVPAIPGAAHTVQVCVAGVGAGAAWRVDDTSITIESDP